MGNFINNMANKAAELGIKAANYVAEKGIDIISKIEEAPIVDIPDFSYIKAAIETAEKNIALDIKNYPGRINQVPFRNPELETSIANLSLIAKTDLFKAGQQIALNEQKKAEAAKQAPAVPAPEPVQDFQTMLHQMADQLANQKVNDLIQAGRLSVNLGA